MVCALVLVVISFICAGYFVGQGYDFNRFGRSVIQLLTCCYLDVRVLF